MSVVPYGHEPKKSHRRDAIIYPESPVSLDEPAQLKTFNKNVKNEPLCRNVFLEYLKDEFKNNPHLLSKHTLFVIFPDVYEVNVIEQNANSRTASYNDKIGQLKADIRNYITRKTDDDGIKIKGSYQGDLTEIPFSRFIGDDAIKSLKEQCNMKSILNIYERLANIIKIFTFEGNNLNPSAIGANITSYFRNLMDLRSAINNLNKTNRGGKTYRGGKKNQHKQKSRRIRR